MANGRENHSKTTTMQTVIFVVSIFLLLGAHLTEAKNTIELKSNAVTSTLDGIHVLRKDGRVERAKRSLFSPDMERQLLDRHNKLRRLEYSSDMELLEWNDYLTSMAEDWAKGCVWEHGQPYRPPSELPFSGVGQNLYVYNGTFDAVYGIQLFYDEVKFYDYDTGACSKEPCGHYTQVVWSSSRVVGCAYAYCPQMYKVDIINANYLVCNYGPPGNYVGQKPYKKGPECTGCETGQFWCDDGLCRRDCSVQSTKCQCKAVCQNCGTIIQSNCSCACAPGWHGNDCSQRCADTHANCGANPGWPVSWCNVSYVREGCPAMCSLCTVSTGTDADRCVTTTTTTTTPNPSDTTAQVDISSATRQITSYTNMFIVIIAQILLTRTMITSIM